MTVESTAGIPPSGEFAVLCVWSEPVSSRQVIQRGTFSPAVLERVRKPEPLTAAAVRG